MIWRDLIPQILPHVPGCPDVQVESMIHYAAIRFCRDSHVWEERLQDVYVADGLLLYELSIPDEAEVVSLVYARQEQGRRLIFLHPDINVFGLLSFEAQPDPDKGPVKIRVRLQPSRKATGLPDRIGLDYERALISGALARLLEIPGRDWSAPQLAAYHWDAYRETVAEARTRSARGNAEHPLRVRPHPFI